MTTTTNADQTVMETRSYWGDTINCTKCYVGIQHTREQHDARVSSAL